ncbi:helix-turn-helix transcriptional regulator [Oenococcus sicerae]|uniref:Helix-turn-helix transcriptional regulator n=1 Tax=Oenococcus sicerae TaxID=2203724 RepID=A0ABX5QN69_9LACO|nr:helix-turn-helix transcriptional regulator [Oenococcus sicerae]QAS70232.1 helix-turn-helix transcriptional regulator [Oenococcus sicerae]
MISNTALFTIKGARSRAGKTKSEISKELGISRPTYDSYESYAVPMRFDVGERFAKATGISINSILFWTNTMNKS